MRLWSKCIFVTLLLALPAAHAQAESTGTIVGTVVDAEKGTMLDLAQVYIAELNRSAEWGEDGRFTMAKVPAGECRITAELIGYESATTTVLVVAGEVVSVELELMASAVELEEVVVTGTAVKNSPVSSTYAVAVTGRDKMAEQGSPQAVDFFKNLSASHGVIGERSSWYNANQAATLSESIANVNLRGLGASRTLVLINSRRQTYVPARLIGGRFVDVNAIPSIAVDRVEVLKEGASAIYGSDAVAGVANFLTRADFEGFEVSGRARVYRWRGRFQHRRDLGWEDRRGSCGCCRGMERASGATGLRKGLSAAAVARRRAAPWLVELGESRHFRRWRAGPVDRCHPRPALRAVWRLQGILDLPLPLSAVRESDRGHEPYARFCRDQRRVGQWHGVSL